MIKYGSLILSLIIKRGLNPKYKDDDISWVYDSKDYYDSLSFSSSGNLTYGSTVGFPRIEGENIYTKNFIPVNMAIIDEINKVPIQRGMAFNDTGYSIIIPNIRLSELERR